nr:hypothetical protein [uncultured Mucilaginibacter sp.]
MKNLILFVCLVLAGCGSAAVEHADEVNGPPFKKLDFKGGLKGVHCRHLAERYVDSNNSYQVQALLINGSKKRIKYLQLNATYLNEAGKQVATALGGPEAEIMPGDSGLVVVSYPFQKDSIPNKVVLTVSD